MKNKIWNRETMGIWHLHHIKQN